MKTKLFNLMALFFVAAITLSFTACGDDDDNGSVNKSQLIGKWKIAKTEIYDLNGYLIKELDEYDYSCFSTFEADGTYRWTDGLFPETSTWTLSGNKLVLYGDEVYRVVKLTDEELVLERRWAEQGYGEGDGGYDVKEDEKEYYVRVTED
ncbi:MAG: lipocalin family protein [Bacteroidaceae bacterium]|nr:lipocalin family protein [Bacteroidaceae bacterium]